MSKRSGWARQRGTSNTNARGSAESRRSRKRWLLGEFGDGESAPCSFEGCETIVTFETITVDRFPILGVDGGTYKRGNIRPACEPCNTKHGLEVAQRRAAEAREARKAAKERAA